MSWFEKLMPSRIRTDAERKRGVPEGLWVRCKGCEATLYHAELERSLDVCPKCGHHERMSGRRRLETFLDAEGRVELGANLAPNDPLKFRDGKKYRDRLLQAQRDTGERDALIAMTGRLHGDPIVACAFDFRFMAGSMGSVVGERFVRAVDAALEHRSPLVCFSASGGARMQEALFSLMQMAKTAAALARLRAAGVPYISVMTDPTMGGVSASLAMLGDLNLAEPNALIGFAGPRVIQQTVRETLPDGFQRAEFLLEHGAIDRIVDRREMRDEIALLLRLLGVRGPLSPTRGTLADDPPDEENDGWSSSERGPDHVDPGSEAGSSSANGSNVSAEDPRARRSAVDRAESRRSDFFEAGGAATGFRAARLARWTGQGARWGQSMSGGLRESSESDRCWSSESRVDGNETGSVESDAVRSIASGAPVLRPTPLEGDWLPASHPGLAGSFRGRG